MTKVDGSLRSTVTALQQILQDAGAKTPDAVRQQALQEAYPYPELAAQVFARLDKAGSKDFSVEQISDAFMALLMDADALDALGAGRAKNPWMQVRQVLQRTGMNLGGSLIALYDTVRRTGLGYVPTVLELAKELADGLQGMAPNAAALELQTLAQARGWAPWMVALVTVWRRRRGSLVPPSDADLEELFADAECVKELHAHEGPWEVYEHQSEALRILRHFGESLASLAESASDH
jgi:hypothetical protein